MLVTMFACGPAEEAAPPSEAPGFQVERQIIQPPELPTGSPFSPGVLAGDTLYLAGQVGRDPETREQPEGIEAETSAAMENIGLILKAAGLDYGNLVKCHVLLDDMDNYAPMNETYGSFYEEGHYPARTTVQIAKLGGTFHVEISCIAHADKSSIEIIQPPEGTIPGAMGPYSPGVMAGDALYLSGQGGRNPETNEIAESIEGQVSQAVQNISQVIQAAGLGLENVAYSKSYFLGCENRAVLENAYQAAFPAGANHPRSSLCLPRLPGTISVEITMFAERGDSNTVYLPVHSSPESGDTIGAQMQGTLEKLGAALEQEGLGFEHVVNANVYLKTPDDFPGMNEVFRQFFPEDPPARTTVAILHEADNEGVLVEAALIAVR